MLLLPLVAAACGGAAEASGEPAIQFDPAALELGDVPNGQIVERDVVVRNTGGAPLTVESVTTSCGCTTATLEPMTIPPGATGALHVAFDSGAHGPDLRGPLMRQVMLATNDPARPEAVVELTATITPPE
jgi:hypothetical protein